MSTVQQQNGWVASSLEELRALRVMEATLPSGARVPVRTVTLDELIADEAMPEDLIEIAVMENTGQTVVEMMRELERDGKERLRKISRDILLLQHRLCVRAIVADDPEAVVAELDEYDRAMVAELAQRKIVSDAAGRRFGADSLARFPGADPEPAGSAVGGARPDDGLEVPDVQ